MSGKKVNSSKLYLEAAASAGGPSLSELQSKEAAFGAAETSIRQLMSNGKHKSALDRAKELHKAHGDAASEALLLEAYSARIQDLIRQNLTAEANALLDLVRERYPAAVDRLADLAASALARAGKLEELVSPLNDPSLRAERRIAIEQAIQEQVSDLAALAACPALSSEHPLRKAAAALRQAFAAVTTGPGCEEVLALPEVSRRSPLASWKMLVGAIASFYRRDDETCRRRLDAIKPDSAAVRLVPAIQAMLDGTPGAAKPAASAELVSQITGDVRALKHALEKLDRAFDSADNDSEVLNAIRTAVEECRRNAPGQLERLKQHISVRAALEQLEQDKVLRALGGPSRKDAYFHQLFARGLEQSADPADAVAACALWNEFRLKAVEEGWFAPNGAEVATLYLHTAKLLRDLPQQLIHSCEQAAGRQNRQSAEDLFFLHPEKLYERACVLDPHFEAFSQWMDWAKGRPGSQAERVAEAWHKIRPQDIEPVLYLMEALEKRGSFATALQYLAQAERIDGVHPEVRRARLRLLAGNAMRQIQQKKPALAEEKLEEISRLPQAQQGDRPVFVLALRQVAASVRGDLAQASSYRAELERVLESRASSSLLLSAVTTACKHGALERPEPVQKFSKLERAALPAILARLTALARDIPFELHIPSNWVAEAAKQFSRTPQALDVRQLRMLGEAALQADYPPLAYAVSAAGLERGVPTEAEFLLLRARSLPQGNVERRMVCAAAAAQLAQEHRDLDLAGKAVDLLRGPFPRSSFRLTLAQGSEVLQKEKTEPTYPKGKRTGPNYRSLLGNELCPCPDCRRERGEKVAPFEFDLYGEDDFDGEDAGFEEEDPFGGLEVPADMPPEIAKLLLEETERAVRNGESLEQLLARLSGQDMPPEKKSRKGKRK